MTIKRQALGRGLAALIPSGSPAPRATNEGEVGVPGNEGLATLPIEAIHPAPNQPRKSFDDARLEELADSIRSQGVIQPLVVRQRAKGGYELIAGERRWRAAQRAGLHKVPCVIREVAPERAFEMALVENLQREDLNPIEEAEAYQRLVNDYGYTQETLATRVGKDRSTVANSLRLLRLPESVRALVTGGRLSMGHARALLGLDSMDGIERLARRAVARDMSVRQVEALVRRERQAAATPPAEPTAKPKPSISARDLQERLQRTLGMRVKVVEATPERGQVEINYSSLDELDRLIERLTK